MRYGDVETYATEDLPSDEWTQTKLRLLKVLTEAIEQLAPLQRQVMKSYLAGGVPDAELAARLGKSTESIRNARHKARRNLRTRLRSIEGGP